MHPVDALGRPAAALTVAYLAYRFAKGFAVVVWQAWRDDAETRRHRRALYRYRRSLRALGTARDPLTPNRRPRPLP